MAQEQCLVTSKCSEHVHFLKSAVICFMGPVKSLMVQILHSLLCRTRIPALNHIQDGKEMHVRKLWAWKYQTHRTDSNISYLRSSPNFKVTHKPENLSQPCKCIKRYHPSIQLQLRRCLTTLQTHTEGVWFTFNSRHLEASAKSKCYICKTRESAPSINLTCPLLRTRKPVCFPGPKTDAQIPTGLQAQLLLETLNSCLCSQQ